MKKQEEIGKPRGVAMERNFFPSLKGMRTGIGLPL